jgi:hypothetical protein
MPDETRDMNALPPANLPPAAQRALAEAEERRKAADAASPLPTELGGRNGPEAVRYGDWEKKGIAVDF